MVLTKKCFLLKKVPIKLPKPLKRAVLLCISGFIIASGLFVLVDSVLNGLNVEFSLKSTGHFSPNDSRRGRFVSREVQNKGPELYDPTCGKGTHDFKVTDLLPEKEVNEFEPICDRIHLQLEHVPKSYQLALQKNEEIPMKTIYLAGGKQQWYMEDGQSYFLEEKCPVNRCSITYNRDERYKADAIVFSNPGSMPYSPPLARRSYDQIWAMSTLEIPQNTQSPSKYSHFFNWTMTYRRDSTIVTPYFKFLYYDTPSPKNKFKENIAAGKTKAVAWMVSNCRLVSSGRMTYARKLAKFINVDIYGRCGTKSCSRSTEKKCMQMIKNDYKFYLSFENSKCLDYITEKFNRNALK